MVFRDVELWQGRKAPRWPQAVVITQAAEADVAAAELTAQVPLHTGEVVVPGGDMEGIDHHLGRLIGGQGSQELTPQLAPLITGEQVVLQLGPQLSDDNQVEGSRQTG